MKISTGAWIIFIVIAILSFFLWFHFAYPYFSFVDSSFDKKQAIEKAEFYLTSQGVDTKTYSKSIVFDTDDWADRYLQKTLGLKKENEFISQHNYELFFWRIRFFKQFQKEEYIVSISAKTGKILSFTHLIEDIEPRETKEENVARIRAENFLRETFDINLDEYEFHEVKIKRLENRIDYSFSWQHKDVYIPWRKEEGGAKLLTGATISGNEVRQFFKHYLDIPEKFSRYVKKQLILGEYLTSFYLIVLTFLIASSVHILGKKENHLISRFCKKRFLYLALSLIIFSLISFFNNLQNILIDYSTSVSLSSHIGIRLVKVIISILLFNAAFILIGIAGESLRYEALNENQQSSLLHYFRSTFFSRNICGAILFGYLLFVIMLGVQAIIFDFGQKHLGVWKEYIRFTQFSSAYIPFLSAFIIGVSASINEEVLFRIFTISWMKKYFKNILLAIVFSSIIWGFGHSGYAIFPVWFRGVEVSIIGLIYGVIFIKFGIIPLIVAHYLFDVFWGIASFVLAGSTPYLFTGSLFVFALPLIWAVAAYILKKEEKERQIEEMLDEIQKYNLGVLMTYISDKKSRGVGMQELKEELIRHNWDIELVDLAIREVSNTN